MVSGQDRRGLSAEYFQIAGCLVPGYSRTIMQRVEKAAGNRSVASLLRDSKIFVDYEGAFREATGLPINLRAPESLQLSHHGDPNESPFCALMANTNRSCAACLQMQRRIELESGMAAKSLRCFAGLCDSAVPVRVGENVVAFLTTGQILLHKPTREQFAKTTRALLKWGAEVDIKRLEEAYFQTRVIPKKQYESVIRLLSVFAQHLSSLSNQLIVEKDTAESPAVSRARVFITEHHSDPVALADVARAVNMSAFHFCKTFKKATGMTFTAYLARVRVEKVKNLMLNPNKRVSEAAFDAGFQSLSQFNRVFRRITGDAPSAYRRRIHRSFGS
jgi:AraC-like DNA-binding protein/ligand-binding sensor protein